MVGKVSGLGKGYEVRKSLGVEKQYGVEETCEVGESVGEEMWVRETSVMRR